MHKLSCKLLDKITEDCTGTEQMFVLYLAMHQDYYGLVQKVFYKDVAEVLCIHEKYFYDLLESLERKNIIEVDRINSSHRYWTIRLLNNTFRTFDAELLAKDIEKAGGYLDLNKDFLLSPEFMKLRSKEKKLAVLLLRFEKRGTSGTSISSLMEWISEKDENKFKEYIESLKQFFVIQEGFTVRKEKKYIIVLKKQHHKAAWTAQINRYRQKLIEYCRSIKIKITDEYRKNIDDIAALIKQYKKKIGQGIANILTTAIFSTQDKYGCLNAAAVHSELLAKINLLDQDKKQHHNQEPKERSDKRTFNNFDNRTYNAEALEEMLLKKSKRDLIPE